MSFATVNNQDAPSMINDEASKPTYKSFKYVTPVPRISNRSYRLFPQEKVFKIEA